MREIPGKEHPVGQRTRQVTATGDVRFLGVDVGSVTTKIVLTDRDGHIIFEDYIRNEGGPIWAMQEGFRRLTEGGWVEGIRAVGTTGSGRELAKVIVGADVVKNEISSHAKAASFLFPDVGTLIDIGGQDSKIVFFKNGYPVGFNMNTVCAAGTVVPGPPGCETGHSHRGVHDWPYVFRTPAR